MQYQLDAGLQVQGSWGLGILNLKKFASALRIQLFWAEWSDPPKPWVRLGNPCDENDKNIFAAATNVLLGNGIRASFWESAWLDGMRPKDIAPKIFDLSKRRGCSVQKALDNNFWVSQVKTDGITSATHLTEFVNLWEKLSVVQLNPDVADSISWKLSNDGSYSASSAYKVQFLGLVDSNMQQLVWKIWAPPKCKFFAWLVINNRIWTADRLQRRGWPNCDRCPLCKQVQETAAHLLFQCRYTVRVWEMIKSWLGLVDVNPTAWVTVHSVKAWWNLIDSNASQSRRAMMSLIMLISWEIWNERNARVFRNTAVPVGVLVARIKDVSKCWCLAGAKYLSTVVPRE